MSQSPPRPPRTASGFTPQPGVRQTTSFKIRAESRKSKPHVPPPTVVLVEDLIPKYDLELEDLKKWLEERFPGQDFEDVSRLVILLAKVLPQANATLLRRKLLARKTNIISRSLRS